MRTEAEADAAIAAARDDYPDHFVFMEVVVDKRDAAPGAGALRAGFVGRHFRCAAAVAGGGGRVNTCAEEKAGA